MTISTHPNRTTHRAWKALATAGVTAALAVTGAGVAEAAQTGTLGPNQGRSFATWFFGKTQVCVRNLSTSEGSSFNWVSSSTSGYQALAPGQEYCMARSFAGFRIYIQNTTYDTSLGIRFPIGP